MSKRIAIVTGASRGLGLETARELARRGYRVIVTARSQEKAEAGAKTLAAEGLEAEPGVVDVASDDSVAAFVDHVRKDIGRVDVLVNNAGAIFESTNDRGDEAATDPLHLPTSVMLEAFNNNALGAYRMTQGLLPLMNEAGYGRVVNVSSGMGALNDMGGGWPAYRVSKTALNAVTRVFHNVAGAGVKVNTVCPGWVRTDMGGSGATRSIPEGAAGIVTAATLADDGPSGVFLRDGEIIDW